MTLVIAHHVVTLVIVRHARKATSAVMVTPHAVTLVIAHHVVTLVIVRHAVILATVRHAVTLATVHHVVTLVTPHADATTTNKHRSGSPITHSSLHNTEVRSVFLHHVGALLYR